MEIVAEMYDPESGDNAVVEFLLASLDWVRFIETYFMDPDDPEEHMKLTPWQRQAMRLIQYSPKKGFMALAPRGYAKSTFFQLVTAVFIITNAGRKVGYLSLGQEEAERSVALIEQFIRNSPFKYLIPKRHPKNELLLINGAGVKAYPISPHVRGKRFALIIFDEWSRLPDDFVKSDCRRTLSLKYGWKEIGGSTPFGMGGDFYEQWSSTDNDDIYDKFVVKDRIVYDDNYNILEFEGAVPWITVEDYLRLCRQLGPRVARQEMNAEFISAADALFDPVWINRAYDMSGDACPIIRPDVTEMEIQEVIGIYGRPDDGKPRSRDVTLDIGGYSKRRNRAKNNTPVGYPFLDPSMYEVVLVGDFARYVDRTVFMIMTRRPVWVGNTKKTRRIEERICVNWIESHADRDPQEFILPRVVKLVEKFKPTKCVFDGNGLGIGIIPFLRKAVNEACDAIGQMPPHFYSNRTDRLGFTVAGKADKENLMTTLELAFANEELLIPYHHCSRPGEAVRYTVSWELYSLEKELMNFRYERQEGVAGPSFLFGRDKTPDDRAITLAMGTYVLHRTRSVARGTGHLAVGFDRSRSEKITEVRQNKRNNRNRKGGSFFVTSRI